MAGVQLQLRARLYIPVERHGQQPTAQGTVVNAAFTLFVEGIDAIAKRIVVVEMAAEIDVAAKGAAALIPERHLA